MTEIQVTMGGEAPVAMLNFAPLGFILVFFACIVHPHFCWFQVLLIQELIKKDE